jgi:hypothetical protein
MGRRRGQPGDRFQWLLRKEAEAYASSQHSGRPRNGVTWFAVDSLGHVAMFDSSHGGNVPLTVFANSLEEHLALYEHIARPSEEEMIGDVEVDAPKQGLYFYGLVEFYARPVLMAATLNLDGYDRLGVPESPLTISQFPEPVRWLIEKVHFGGAFRDTSKMFADQYWKCV